MIIKIKQHSKTTAAIAAAVTAAEAPAAEARFAAAIAKALALLSA